ncbi:MAG: hypothetical protein P1U83_12090 [Roseovarius sp.]|nr:hypothetical protein [Roseovarius sp.]
MSDPVTNVEIEDVLSSIRRLVSTDDRADARPQATAEPEPEKLVLTPALRVTTAEKPAETVGALADEDSHEASTEDTQDAAEDYQNENLHSDDEAHTAQAEDGSAVQDVWADDEGDGHDEAEESLDAQADTHDATTAQDDQEADNTESDVTPDATDESEGLSAQIAGIEEAVAARDDGWEPDGEDQGDDNAAQPMETLPWQDHEGEAQTDTFVEAEDVSATEGLDAFELEEDDMIAPEVHAPSPDPVADIAAANAFFGDDEALGDDDTILDEEALRDLVTEIVRQELQGSLGERITRNVRKLVRREIHRALTTQELE